VATQCNRPAPTQPECVLLRIPPPPKIPPPPCCPIMRLCIFELYTYVSQLSAVVCCWCCCRRWRQRQRQFPPPLSLLLSLLFCLQDRVGSICFPLNQVLNADGGTSRAGHLSRNMWQEPTLRPHLPGKKKTSKQNSLFCLREQTTKQRVTEKESPPPFGGSQFCIYPT
jgi:hypothetical protein